MNQNDLRRLAAIGGMDLTQPSVSFKDFNMFKNKGFDLLQDYQNTNKFIADNNLMQPPVDEEADKKAKRKEGLQNLRDTLAIIGARRSGKYTLAEQMKQQVDLRKQQEEQQKKQAELLSSMSPEQRRIYETFGPNAAFAYEQQQNNAEIAGLQEARQRQSLKNAGFSDREIDLFIGAGMEAKDIIELRDVEPDGSKSFGQLQKEVESKYVPSEGLQVIDQAFGIKDTIDNAFNKAVGPIFGTPAKETNAAINSKNILNENLRERFVNQYSGRPSVYLNQRIDALLPMGTYISEFDAMQKYAEIKRVLDQGKAELEENINSGMFEGQDLLTLQNEYKSTSFLLKDLETVIGNLTKDDSTSLDIVSEGKNPGQMTGQFGTFFGVDE